MISATRSSTVGPRRLTYTSQPGSQFARVSSWSGRVAAAAECGAIGGVDLRMVNGLRGNLTRKPSPRHMG